MNRNMRGNRGRGRVNANRRQNNHNPNHRGRGRGRNHPNRGNNIPRQVAVLPRNRNLNSQPFSKFIRISNPSRKTEFIKLFRLPAAAIPISPPNREHVFVDNYGRTSFKQVRLIGITIHEGLIFSLPPTTAASMARADRIGYLDVTSIGLLTTIDTTGTLRRIHSGKFTSEHGNLQSAAAMDQNHDAVTQNVTLRAPLLGLTCTDAEYLQQAVQVNKLYHDHSYIILGTTDHTAGFVAGLAADQDLVSIAANENQIVVVIPNINP